MSRKPIPDRDAAFADPNLRPTPSWLEYFKDADKRTPGIAYSTTAPTNGQAYAYNSTTGLLEPVTPVATVSVAKAWVSFTGATAAILTSHNVASVTRNSAGNFVVTFTTPFASANYVGIVSGSGSGFIGLVNPGGTGGITASQMPVQFLTTTFAATDPTTGHVVFFGNQ